MSIGFRFAARSHVGIVRSGNEDAGLADSQMLAVADGMGGHAAGEVASAAVVQTIAESIPDLPQDREAARQWVVDRINDAHNRVGDLVAAEPDRRGMGTTLSVVLACDDGLLMAHVGDSRVYLFKAGVLQQASTDHTYVQSLVESGEITVEQAAHHPRRNLLMRAIDGVHPVEVDVELLDLAVGERLLLCSDGLTAVISDAAIADVLRTPDLTLAVTQLIDFALAAGAPDNVTVVLAEVIAQVPTSEPCLVGSAVSEDLAPALAAAESHGSARKVWHKLLPAVAIIAAVVVAALSFNGWLTKQWYLGTDGRHVVIYQGISSEIGPIALYRAVEETPVSLAALSIDTQQALGRGLLAESLESAREVLAEIVAAEPCAATGCESP